MFGEGWFEENLCRTMGDGEDTLFKTDRWMGDVPFCVRFCRLFELTDDKGVKVT